MAIEKSIQRVKIHESSLMRFCDGLTDQPVSVKTCKFCQSKHREAAESEFERTKGYASAYNLLKNKGVDISRPAVRNHLKQHYLSIERKARVAAYAADLPSFLEQDQNRKTQLRERVWMLQRLMYDIASDSDDISLDERRKSADAMKKLSDAITSLEDSIEQIDQKMEPVEVVIEKLSTMIGNRVKKTDDENTKRMLMDMVDELVKITDDIFV